MITGSIYIDLTREPTAERPNRDRRALAILEQCPDGARVIVDIGRRTLVTSDAAAWLHEHGARLLIEVRGTRPIAVSHFIAAARAGDWSAVMW